MKRFILFLLLLFTAASLYTWLKPNNRLVPAFAEGELHLVIGDRVVNGAEPRIVNDEVMLELDIVQQYLDPYIYWDEKLQKVTITTEDKVLRMKTESLDAIINNKPLKLNIPADINNEKVYVPVESLADLYRIKIQYDKTENVIIIDREAESFLTAIPASGGAVVRSGMSRKNPVYKRFSFEGDEAGAQLEEMRIFSEDNKWYRVRTAEGIVGYIEKRFVKTETRQSSVAPPKPVVDEPPVKGRISLVWDMMYGKKLDEKIEGLDIISPTWFYLSGSTGDISNKASLKYVEWAHEKGYRVWALFGNGGIGPDKTKEVLNNTDTRDKIIRQLLTFASMYRLDGINFDFENMYEADKRAYTQFIREAAVLLREQGLTISVDVGVPDGSEFFSRCYDHKALGEAADYIALMTYDQHWSTSPVAGSVAQIAWVEKYLNKTLKLVPPEKLLLGLPFYTRLWKEQPDEDGAVKVSSPKPLTMDEAKSMIVNNDAEVEWDEKSGQFYTTFTEAGATYKIWVEDANSINLRSALVLKYGLAGTAAWSRTFEEREVWEVIRKNLKQYKSYEEWKRDNETRKASISLD